MTATQKKRDNPYLALQRMSAQNRSSADAIPAFGLVRIVDTTAQGAPIVDRLSEDGQEVYVNGPNVIPPCVAQEAADGSALPPIGGYGVISKASPIWAAYDENSGTPAIGDAWGATPGSYLLTKNKSGFIVQGLPITNNGPKRVLVCATGGGSASLAWVRAVGPTPQTIYLGRQVKDAVLAKGSYVVGSVSANFSAADLGAMLAGSGIPSGATISSVTSATAIVMTKQATQSAAAAAMTIASSSIVGFAAKVDTWVGPQGASQQWSFQDGSASCWLLSSNSPDPTTAATPHNQFPLAGFPPFLLGTQVAADAAGAPIFVWPYDPAARYDTMPSTAYPITGAFTQYGPLAVNSSAIVLGYPQDKGAVQGVQLYVAQAPAAQAYAGCVGMDSIGNQFINGVNVAAGGGMVFISGGSDP